MSRALPPRAAALALLATLALGLGACREPSPTPEPTAEPTALSTPTIVARIEPTPTPTVDPAEQPLHPGLRDEVPGVPIPIGARVVDLAPATADSDLRVQLALDGYEEEVVYDWYREHMPAYGWGDVEDRDGSLIFLHDEQLSQRFADDGLRRTATILFIAIDEEANWTMVVEAPEGGEPPAAQEEGDADTEEEEGDAVETDEGADGSEGEDAAEEGDEG